MFKGESVGTYAQKSSGRTFANRWIENLRVSRGLVCRFIKTFYGLHQSGLVGLIPLKLDPSLCNGYAKDSDSGLSWRTCVLAVKQEPILHFQSIY